MLLLRWAGRRLARRRRWARRVLWAALLPRCWRAVHPTLPACDAPLPRRRCPRRSARLHTAPLHLVFVFLRRPRRAASATSWRCAATRPRARTTFRRWRAASRARSTWSSSSGAPALTPWLAGCSNACCRCCACCCPVLRSPRHHPPSRHPPPTLLRRAASPRLACRSAEHGDYFGIGVSGYPEAHPDVIVEDGEAMKKNYWADIAYLKQKVRRAACHLLWAAPVRPLLDPGAAWWCGAGRARCPQREPRRPPPPLLNRPS